MENERKDFSDSEKDGTGRAGYTQFSRRSGALHAGVDTPQ